MRSGEYAEAIPLIETSVRLNPRSPDIQDRYSDLARCAINIGRDKEGIAWADRALVGDLTAFERKTLLLWQAAAYARTGEQEAAKRALDAALRIDPFDTVRARAPNVPDSPADRDGVPCASRTLCALPGFATMRSRTRISGLHRTTRCTRRSKARHPQQSPGADDGADRRTRQNADRAKAAGDRYNVAFLASFYPRRGRAGGK